MPFAFHLSKMHLLLLLHCPIPLSSYLSPFLQHSTQSITHFFTESPATHRLVQYIPTHIYSLNFYLLLFHFSVKFPPFIVSFVSFPHTWKDRGLSACNTVAECCETWRNLSSRTPWRRLLIHTPIFTRGGS